LNVKRYKEIFGFPVKHYYSRLGFNFDKEPFEKISVEFITEYQKESLSAKLSENCIPALEYIRNEGIQQVILSASQIENLEEQVRHFGITGYFDRLLGLDHCHATSKVDIGKKWLKESGFDKKEVLLVGDTLHDYETASEIGCDCILLSSGHQSKERVSCHGVPVIESLAEVKQYLRTGIKVCLDKK
jgi:phosphoglycolate phosphatase